MQLSLAKRTLLVGALLLGQLVCLLMGVAWFARWVESGLEEVVRQQVIGASRQIASQFALTLEMMDISGTPLSKEDWERLQRLVEETYLPYGGQLVVIDSDTGQVIAHPDLRDQPERVDLPYAEALLSRPVESPEAWTRLPDGAYVLAATAIEDLGAQMLVLQPEEPLRDVIADVARRIRLIGAVVTVVLVAFSAVLSFLIMQTYEDRLGSINQRLEELVERRSRALTRSREGAIFGLARLAESRDGETGEHLERISTYTELLARELARRNPSLTPRWIQSLRVAASLHDIGKVGVPDAVLHKPGPLTEEEREIVQQHPLIGGEALAQIKERWGDDPFLTIASEVCAGHHERWDGTGYPRGLAGTEIPTAARIFAVVDVYDALTSDRPYRRAWPVQRALDHVREGAGSHFDPNVVDAFLAMIEERGVGPS